MNMMRIYIRYASPWTDERVAILRRMWTDGYSASVIADHLGAGISRNAVIGKVHRIGLGGRSSPIRSRSKRPERQERKPRVYMPRRPVLPTSTPLVARVEPPQPPGDYSTTIEGLQMPIVRCRWIEGEPTADALYCGARVARPGVSYCPEHEARCWAPYRRRVA